jgi:CRISPR/Cas system-associated exonuclease Cas4 (RecB family)
MSSYDFIVDDITYSYSSTSSFENCAWGFKLSYIDAKMPRADNFFAEYGNLVHDVFEQFFTDKVDIYELSKYYMDNYKRYIKTPAPVENPGLEEKYIQQGKDFFDNISFDKDAYEVLYAEDKIDFNVGDVKFTARPDLVLKEKATAKNILFDYKTATPFWTSKKDGKENSDSKKINGYYQQMYMYTHALRNFKNIAIDDISLWFPRLDKILTVPWEQVKEDEAITKVLDTVKKIKEEEYFPYNNSSPYFCNNLCSVREFCTYRNG